METTPEMRHAAAVERHERDTRREIVLPAAIALAVLVLAVLISAFVSNRYEELSLISNFVLTLLLLCPAALCMLPLALALVVGAVGMNRVHDWSEARLATVNRVAYKANRRVDSLLDRLGEAGVEFGARAAPLEAKVFNAFDRPLGTDGTEGEHEPSAERHPDASTSRGRDSKLED